jgi:hypothetical protein
MDANDLLYLRARYYSPALGVFTALDPVENLNRYQYAGANPTNWADPSGLQSDKYEGCVDSCWDDYYVAVFAPFYTGATDAVLAAVESCITMRCNQGCPWSDYSELLRLVPQIKEAAQRWNRISLNDLGLIANEPCALEDFLRNSNCALAKTGFSDDAFAAIIAARLHQENKLLGSSLKQQVGDFLTAHRPDFLESALRSLPGYSGTVGIANIGYITAEEILKGVYPRGPWEGVSFDISRLEDVGGEDYTVQLNSQKRLKDRGGFLKREDVSIQLQAANYYRAILLTRSRGRVIPEASGPTVFNLAAWDNNGELHKYTDDSKTNANKMLDHVYEILEGDCRSLGLRAMPWRDFAYYNEHDACYVNFETFRGTPSHYVHCTKEQ